MCDGLKYQGTVKEVITLRDNQNKIYEEMIETKGKADEIHEKYLQVQAELFQSRWLSLNA